MSVDPVVRAETHDSPVNNIDLYSWGNTIQNKVASISDDYLINPQAITLTKSELGIPDEGNIISAAVHRNNYSIPLDAEVTNTSDTVTIKINNSTEQECKLYIFAEWN